MKKLINVLAFLTILAQLTLGQNTSPGSAMVSEYTFAVNKPRKLLKQLEELPIFRNSFSGLCVYDVQEGRYVVEHNADRYFTPASNTKLFSFYAGLELIGERIPGLKYVLKPDSLLVWGTGNPLLLHHDFPDTAALAFLRQAQVPIYLATDNFHDSHLGFGWAWGDYTAYYSAEKSPMPLYGNVLRFGVNDGGQLSVQPACFTDSVRPDTSLQTPSGLRVERHLLNNHFRYQLAPGTTATTEDVPLHQSPQLAASLLAKALGKPVQWIQRPMRAADTLRTLYSYAADSLYRPMLLESDNFMAEHILYLCADSINHSRYLETRNLIQHIGEKHLADLSQSPRWVDGSGLSRYNLFTPKSMVEVLLKIRKKMGNDSLADRRLQHLLPAGGKTGTLRNRFNQHPPFVFAKTGTLSNNHNLSGFLYTKSGKILVFSYMNNHFQHPTALIRRQTDKILTDFYLFYQ